MVKMRDAMVVVVVVGALERPYWLFLLTMEVCGVVAMVLVCVGVAMQEAIICIYLKSCWQVCRTFAMWDLVVDYRLSFGVWVGYCGANSAGCHVVVGGMQWWEGGRESLARWHYWV